MIRPWGVGRALYSTLDPPTLGTRPTVVVNAPNAIAMGLGGKVGFVRASPDCHSHAWWQLWSARQSCSSMNNTTQSDLPVLPRSGAQDPI